MTTKFWYEFLTLGFISESLKNTSIVLAILANGFIKDAIKEIDRQNSLGQGYRQFTTGSRGIHIVDRAIALSNKEAISAQTIIDCTIFLESSYQACKRINITDDSNSLIGYPQSLNSNYFDFYDYSINLREIFRLDIPPFIVSEETKTKIVSCLDTWEEITIPLKANFIFLIQLAILYELGFPIYQELAGEYFKIAYDYTIELFAIEKDSFFIEDELLFLNKILSKIINSPELLILLNSTLLKSKDEIQDKTTCTKHNLLVEYKKLLKHCIANVNI